jgi:DNA-binding transcriptional LysR family regulator
MELTDLALFLEVAEHGSLSRAAAGRRLAQPSVSTRVAGLERSLSVLLFDRTTRGVTLTAAGRALIPYARRCLALAEEGRQAARASAGSRRLTLVSPPSLAASIFPPVLAALAAEPLEITCRTAHSREVVEQLADGAAHVGFLTGAAAAAGIEVEPLYSTPVIAVTRPSHPLATARPRLGELAGHHIAAHSWGPAVSELDAALREAGLPPTQTCWVSPATTALALAAEHGYIALVPADASGSGLSSGVLTRLHLTGLPQWQVSVSVAYRQRDAGHQPVAATLRAVRTIPMASPPRL